MQNAPSFPWVGPVTAGLLSDAVAAEEDAAHARARYELVCCKAYFDFMGIALGEVFQAQRSADARSLRYRLKAVVWRHGRPMLAAVRVRDGGDGRVVWYFDGRVRRLDDAR